MGPQDVHPHVSHLQACDLAGPQAATAGQTKEDQVQPRVPGARGFALQVR